MFKTALLSCFLVSLSSTYGMHLVVSSEKNESNTSKISVEEISSSEPSVITVQSATHASVNQNGFISKTSSATSTSRSFRDLQELEKLCD